MTFQHEICAADGEPITILVTGRIYRDGDARGSLSCAPATYFEITRIRDVATKTDITDNLTQADYDAICDVAVSLAA